MGASELEVARQTSEDSSCGLTALAMVESAARCSADRGACYLSPVHEL